MAQFLRQMLLTVLLGCVGSLADENCTVGEDYVLLQTDRPCNRKLLGDSKPRYTLGVSVYDVQPGIAAAGGAIGVFWLSNYFPHMSVFWLPYEINPFGPHWGSLYAEKKECGKVEYRLGKKATIQECAQAVSRTHRCGPVFMWSQQYSPNSDTWDCRCCKDDHTDGGGNNPSWNLYMADSNWLCYENGPGSRFTPKVPGNGEMQLINHTNGACGDPDAVATQEIGNYGNGESYALEMTYSSGHGGNYDQTWAAGPPGNYVTYSGGSNKMWHGHASKIYYHTTDLTFEDFFKTGRRIAVDMNDDGGYDAARNNCQEWSLRMLEAVGATDLFNKAIGHTFVRNDVLKAAAIPLCDLGSFTSQCWPIQGGGSDRRRRRHVGMPDNCHQKYDYTPAVAPVFYGGVYTCR